MNIKELLIEIQRKLCIHRELSEKEESLAKELIDSVFIAQLHSLPEVHFYGGPCKACNYLPANVKDFGVDALKDCSAPHFNKSYDDYGYSPLKSHNKFEEESKE